MGALTGWVLLRPWWLLALLPAAGLFALLRRRGALGAWRRAMDRPLLAALAARGAVLPASRSAQVLPLALAALLALALAGPAHERAATTTFRNLGGLVVAFDVSRSVAQGGNLIAARLAASRAIAAAAPRAVALLAYAGDAYVASGFTTDPGPLGETLAALDGDTVPDAGSRPARALAQAAALLDEAHVVGGDVLLVSDGGGLGPAALAEARRLAAAGHTVSTLFVPAGDALPEGAPAPDRVAMEVLAAQGGGAFAGIGRPDAVLRELALPPPRRLARSDFAVLAWRDLGRWLLLAALLPAGLLFRRMG